MRTFLLCLCLLVATGTHAQRYGHLNFANVLSELPGTKAAESELEAFNKQLVARGEQMVRDLEAKANTLEGERSNLAPVEFQKRVAALQKDRQAIQSYEQEVAMKIERKRQELLGPLIQQVKDAVTRVAEANNFALVFDTSIFNAVLFAEDSEDLLSLVKAELGME